jgi:hypothetical protein
MMEGGDNIVHIRFVVLVCRSRRLFPF